MDITTTINNLNKILHNNVRVERGTVAERSRALTLLTPRNRSEWTVPSSNPGEGCYGEDRTKSSCIDASTRSNKLK